MEFRYRSLLCLSAVLFSVAWISHMEEAALSSILILLVAAIFLLFWSYQTFRRQKSAGGVKEFLFGHSLSTISESDNDYSFYASIFTGILLLVIGLFYTANGSNLSAFWLIIGIAQIAYAIFQRRKESS